MLIQLSDLHLPKKVTGVIHIGAHECEERDGYMKNFNIGDDKTIWIEAIKAKVDLMKTIYPSVNILNYCISNVDNEEVEFMITNNFQSSSMLNFKTHAQEHPHVKEMNRIKMHTKTLNTIFKENNLNPETYNFMNLDIQGAELLALKGASDILSHIDYIYCEVNVKELYENCALLPELDSFLKSHNFIRVKTVMTHHGWGDAFYVKVV
jgi:FkbM family methyltransferase